MDLCCLNYNHVQGNFDITHSFRNVCLKIFTCTLPCTWDLDEETLMLRFQHILNNCLLNYGAWH